MSVSEVLLSVCRISYGKAPHVSAEEPHYAAMTQLPDFWEVEVEKFGSPIYMPNG